MSSLFSEETKRKLEMNLLNQLTLSATGSLEAEPQHQIRSRLFSPNDVFLVLYGTTRPQQGNKDVLSTQTTTQSMTTEPRINTACDFCKTMPHGKCPVHRDSTQTPTSKGLPYAIKSLPPACKLCLSNVEGECYGVYANRDIPLGTWIGPYEGRRIRPCYVTPNMDTSHMWEIYEGSTLSHYIDGRDENIASWMRYIRCARHKDEQNLFAFQYNGNIYYRAFKDIPSGTELLVWYDDKYPMYMGIPLGMQVDAVYATNTTTTNQSLHDSSQDDTPQLQQYCRPLNTFSSASSQNSAVYTSSATSAQFSQTRIPLQSYHDPKGPPTNSKNLLPLISTYSALQRRASVDDALSGQRSPALSDLDSSTSNAGNKKVPSPSNELTSWQCQQCHKTFTQRVALQMHVCPCQPTKPYQCGQCSSTFNNSSELRAHVVSHTTERPFKCGFCARTFVGATTLNNHVRTHMGQKPFGCEKCGKTFSQAMQLAKHARESCDCVGGSSGSDSAKSQALTS